MFVVPPSGGIGPQKFRLKPGLRTSLEGRHIAVVFFHDREVQLSFGAKCLNPVRIGREIGTAD